jgi:hypothetical protein
MGLLKNLWILSKLKQHIVTVKVSILNNFFASIQLKDIDIFFAIFSEKWPKKVEDMFRNVYEHVEWNDGIGFFTWRMFVWETVKNTLNLKCIFIRIIIKYVYSL